MCVRAKAGDPVCAIMLDIDHFKRVNDSFGHVAGDETICGVARSASATGAVVGRLGGEEFAMLLPGHDLAAATAVAEDLRRTLAAQEFASGGRAIKLTCSFGVSEWGNGEQIDQILMRADVALYAAKSEGRNRVVVASAALSSPASESSTHSIRLDARVERAVHAGPRARAAAGR
jgi:diguanylate cyclase (GGDEF)-like protein